MKRAACKVTGRFCVYWARSYCLDFGCCAGHVAVKHCSLGALLYKNTHRKPCHNQSSCQESVK